MNGAEGRATLRERWPDLLVGLAIGIELVHGWYTRHAFNPDGVSYLDLAGRLRAGDLSSFVQGYWSPAFPFLVANGSVVTGGAPLAMLFVAHALSVVAAVAAILLIRRWGEEQGRPWFTAAGVLALLLVSDGIPKLETVSPDILALACMVWLAYELLARNGDRWIHTGLALGLTFLIRSSSWIWLLLAFPLRLWAARAGAERRRVIWSTGLSVVIAALWVVPLSIRSGEVTVGSAARLNYCWYILGCDSRTPDTHLGDHGAYQGVTLEGGQVLRWAQFEGTDKWTYEPWSDPTTWQAGVVTQRVNPDPWSSVGSYWARQAHRVFGDWLLPVALLVALPWTLLGWSPGAGRRYFAEGRPVLVAVLLGLAGVVQFVAIHAEPRLLAPFGLLAVLALLHGPGPSPSAGDPRLAWLRPWVVVAGLLVAGYYGVQGIRVARLGEERYKVILQGIASTQAQLRQAGVPASPIVIVGPAIPVLFTAYLSGVKIIAQVPPPSALRLRARTADDQRRILTQLFGAQARVAWYTTTEGEVNVVLLGPAPVSTPASGAR